MTKASWGCRVRRRHESVRTGRADVPATQVSLDIAPEAESSAGRVWRSLGANVAPLRAEV